MHYRRYGKFRFSDYISGWLAIAFLLALTFVVLLTDIPIYLSILPLFFSVIMAWGIYKPNSECFAIYEDTITIIKGKKNETVAIPSEPIIIVSYAELVPPIAKRIGLRNETYLLKGRYAVSILQNMPMQTFFDTLHQKYMYRYTDATVEECFGESLFVYSFVGNQELMDKLLSNRNCTLVVPETLLEQISIEQYKTKNLIVDYGY